jgi:hypothetical protein
MQRSLHWEYAQDQIIIAMRANGEHWDDIARAVGRSKSTVRERGAKIGAVLVVPERTQAEPDRTRRPLPAGDPTIWSIISSDPYPG